MRKWLLFFQSPTLVTPTLSEAFALTATDEPETVAPDVGVVMKTVGRTESVAVLTVTVTITDFVALPPAPVHVSVYVEVTAGFTTCVPCVSDIALFPDQVPEAVQDVALVENHVSITELPEVIVVGLAERVRVGAVGEGATYVWR